MSWWTPGSRGAPMSGRHPFSELTREVTPERLRRIKALKADQLADMPPYELRRTRALTQQDLVETNYLYHFSEDPHIERFLPRPVKIGPSDEVLVWGIDSLHCHLYYFPRDCPRVVISKSSRTSAEDTETFFGHTTAAAIAAIESHWLERLRTTTIYRYTLPPEGFALRDETAGYWVSKQEVRPIDVEPIPDLMAALIGAGVELRIMPSLVPMRDAVIASTVEFDIIRWRNAAT